MDWFKLKDKYGKILVCHSSNILGNSGKYLVTCKTVW